jgi:purine-nucleoside/S-methyl-5'-thioadenosine phosphorylase / adenosine deaminase
VDGLVHGFAGRAGGTSEGAFAALNLSYGVGDDPERVRENRRRFSRALGVEPASIAAARQVHGTEILDGSRAPAAAWAEGGTVGEGDAILADRAGVTLVATSADCVAVSIVEPRRGVVGVAHCGWRGTFAGLAGKLVREAVRRHRIAPDELLAAIAPSIGPCCFEVGDEVVALGGRVVREFERFVRAGPRRSHVDLWEMNRAQLVAEGVRADAVEVAGACTRCRRDEFFSYRGGEGRSGIAALAVGFLD